MSEEQGQVPLAVAQTMPADVNHNPDAPVILVGGEPVGTGPTAGTHTLGVEPAEGESYVDADGVTQTEVYTYKWYAESGEIAAGIAGGPGNSSEVEWTVSADASGVLMVVVRDGRGGVAWSSVTFRSIRLKT